MEAKEPQYSEISILTHAEAVESLSELLLSLGAKGIAEERRPLQVRITAYLLADETAEQPVGAVRERLSALEKEGLRIGPGTISVRPVAAQSWGELWKEQFEIQHIAPGLVIAPSWEDYQPQGGECVVVLESGAAFGTGSHATTRLCLRGLVEYIRPGDRVADVGCGTGILAISAALLGAHEVVATDNDPAVVPVARQNIKRNAVTEQVQVIEADLLPSSCGEFDLVVCNIVAEQAIRLAGDLRAILSRGGRFICSGFQAGAVPMVEDALVRGGLRMVATTGEEGWAACVAIRPGIRS